MIPKESEKKRQEELEIRERIEAIQNTKEYSGES